MPTAGKILVVVGLIGIWGISCNTEDAPGCRAAGEYVLPNSALTLTPDAKLFRTGTDFRLVGLDADGSTVRWAAVDDTGGVTNESSLTVPAHAAGPWFAPTSKIAALPVTLVPTGWPYSGTFSATGTICHRFHPANAPCSAPKLARTQAAGNRCP